MKKLLRSQEQLQNWRLKIQGNTREWEERNRALRGQKELMHRHYSALTGGLNTFRAQQHERLKALAKATAACNDALAAKLARAEDIMALVDMCRKLETEQEKVLPFFTEGVPEEGSLAAELAEEQAALREAQASYASTSGKGGAADGGASAPPPFSSHALDEEGRVVEEWDYLNNFFKKFNKALVDKAAVDRERARLEAENGELRTVLKQYLDGISVNDDILNNPLNPLLVVNQRLQLSLAERRRGRPTGSPGAPSAAAVALAAPAAPQHVPVEPQLVVVTAAAR